jgi:hypothetical protein
MNYIIRFIKYLHTTIWEFYIEFILAVYKKIRIRKYLPFRRRRKKTGRNQRCYCGSGMKYKRCCWFRDQEKINYIRQ